MNVLIADDDPISRILLRNLLLQEGPMEISTAEDGEQALKMLQEPERRFDVLFLDINMPKVDGLCVLRNLRAQSPAFDSLKVIICSSVSDDHKEVCLELGARFFISKPALRESVRQKLHLALAS